MLKAAKLTVPNSYSVRATCAEGIIDHSQARSTCSPCWRQRLRQEHRDSPRREILRPQLWRSLHRRRESNGSEHQGVPTTVSTCQPRADALPGHHQGKHHAGYGQARDCGRADCCRMQGSEHLRLHHVITVSVLPSRPLPALPGMRKAEMLMISCFSSSSDQLLINV